MAKDYAKRVFATTRTPKKKWRRIELFIIPVIILGCLLGYWAFAHTTEMMARVSGLFKHKITPAYDSRKELKAVNAVKVNKPDEVHFDFYSELPNMQMSASSDMASITPSKIITPTVKAKLASKYIVHLGEFKDSISASQLQLSLLLAGCDAEIVTIKTANNTIFRVQRGPFIEIMAAKKLQQRLLQKGVESTLTKV